MKVLVLNCGSSSIKYKLYDMNGQKELASGGIEKNIKTSFASQKQQQQQQKIP